MKDGGTNPPLQRVPDQRPPLLEIY
jgi:hypothetical protein